MNNELSLLIKKHKKTLIEQNKNKTTTNTRILSKQKQMDTFSVSPLINLTEEGKWLLTVTSFETTNSVYNITDENNSFSILTAAKWTPEGVNLSSTPS